MTKPETNSTIVDALNILHEIATRLEHRHTKCIYTKSSLGRARLQALYTETAADLQRYCARLNLPMPDPHDNHKETTP